MSPTEELILYTQDADLVRRTKAFLRTLAQVRHVTDPDRLEPVLQQTGPTVLIIDLRAKESRDLLDQIHEEQPAVLIIAVGVAQSEPLREVEQLGIYAVEEVGLDRRRFQALLARAFEYQKALAENRDLREMSGPTPRPLKNEASLTSGSFERNFQLSRFPRILRRPADTATLLASMAEGLAETAGVTRVGIFSQNRKGEAYRFRGGVHCLPETDQLIFGERDALVRWLELNAHLISRVYLDQITDPRKRVMMRRALDMFGAEAIAPIYARGKITGWIFFGHRLTGQILGDRDLEYLTILAEHVSIVLENALLYEETAMEKTLAETLLKSIPPGIVAIDTDANIRWFNPRAEKILGVSSSEALNNPVERAGNKVAGLLREALESQTPPDRQQWIDPNTRRSLSVEARRLASNGSLLGAVAVINDLTAEETVRERQALVDRAAFWTDLAASMSHE
ncbi:MAG TPA: PAS domain-containing protein, partial [Chthoniobacterales bacterium]|nr:PAS domain-containing protein [Chthoniobacterales bacterium]